MINETVSVDAGQAIGELDALAGAADKAAAAFAKLKIPDLGAAGGGGFDKLAAQAEAAAAKIEASFARIADAAKGLGDVGASGAAGLGKLADAENAAAASADRLAKSSAPVEDALKGVGTQTKRNSAWLDEYNATMADSAKIQRDFARVSADTSAKVATSQRLQTAAARDASAEAVANRKAQARAAEESAASAEAASKKHSTAILVGAAAVGYGIYKAAQLQQQVTRLYTSAGEQQKNLPMITQGILKLSGAANTSQSDLAQGAYMVESAGFHGPAALGVLKAAAQGAQAEGAPLGEVGNALTSLMNAYGMKPGQATSAMNQIVAMVAHGKMTMSGAVSALPQVLSVGASAKLPFSQVAGSLSTMTASGMSPDQAAQNLRHTITSLQKPSNVQSAEMQMLGLDPVKLSHDLGKEGLTGTIGEVDQAIKTHMGKGGMVLLDTMNQSRLAVRSANAEIRAMPPSIQATAKAYLDGSINAKAWNQEVRQGSFSARDANLLKQFSGTAGTALGFSQMIKSGQGNQQTQAAALNALMGGQTGQQVALMLGGDHMKTAKANVDAVAEAAKHAGQNIEGWGQIQAGFNFKLGQFKYTAEAAATTVGDALLPSATKVMGVLAGAGSFLADHPDVTKGVAGLGGILGAGYALRRVQKPVTTAIQGVGKIAETLHIPGLDKLAGVGKDAGLSGSAAALDGAAGSLEGAAGSLSGAAGRLSAGGLAGGAGAGEGAAAGAAARGAGAGEGAAVAEGAVGGGVLSKVVGGGAALLRGGIGFAIADIAERLVAASLPKPTKAQAAGLKPDEKGLGWWIDQHMLGRQGAENAGNLIDRLQKNVPIRHSIASTFDATRHGVSSLFSSTGTAGTQTPQENIRFGAGVVGATRPPPRPAVPAPFYGEVPQSRPAPFYGEVPQPGGAASQRIPQLSLGGHPAAAPTVQIKVKADTSALAGDIGAAKGKLQALSQVTIKPPKMPAPDMAALDGAKGKAASAGSGITQAIQGAMHPAKMPPPNLSAASAAAGAAQGIGANISAGLAAGIRSGIGAIQAAAAAAAAAASVAMAHAVQSHSPSKVTEKIGKDFDAGFIVGLQGGQDAVKAAAAAVGKSAAKASDVTTIDSTVKKLLAQVPKGDTGLTALLKVDNAKLDTLAQKRAQLETEITDAGQITSAAISGASIMNATSATSPAGNEPQSWQNIVQGMQNQADTQTQFTAAIGDLKKKGLNATELNQLVQAGAASGLPIAQGIDQGGKQAISQLNAIQGKIKASASKLGSEAAPSMYQAGKDLTSGIAAGLKADLGSVDKAMKKIADEMTAAVGKVAKTTKAAAKKAGASSAPDAASGAASAASGSAAAARAAGAGKDPLSAAGASLSAAGSALSAAASALSSAASSLKGAGGGGGAGHVRVPAGGHAVAHPGAPSGGGYGGGAAYLPTFGAGGQHIHYHQAPVAVHVAGSVTAERDLLNTLQEAQLHRSSNNWQSGWQLPGHPN